MSVTKEDDPACVSFPSGSRFLIAAVMVAVCAAIFLCPLYIQTRSPCVTDELPKKPDLIGHRGAPMVSIALFSTAPRRDARAEETFVAVTAPATTVDVSV